MIEKNGFNKQVGSCAFAKALNLFSSLSDRFSLYFMLTAESYPVLWPWRSFNFLLGFLFLGRGGLQDAVGIT